MTTRNVVLISALVGFVSGLGGANVQPILTGAGKLIFPENATPATLSASSGALTIAAGGSNQNVVLTPSGTGFTSSVSPLQLNPGATPNASQIVLRSNAAGALSLLNFSQTNQQIQMGYERSGGNSVAGDANAFRILRSAAAVSMDWMTGLTAGNTFSFTNPASATIDLTNGNWGFGGAVPSYQVDVAGDVNASGVFRKGGTAGTGGNTLFTVCTSGACITSCTLQFSGGIRVGGTCP